MPLAKPDANWTDYLNHLELLAKWLMPIEAWLAQCTDCHQSSAEFEFIRYSDFIVDDLSDENLILSFPREIAKWPANNDAAYRWGIYYVIEGSQLGGEFLYKRLATRLMPHQLKYLQQKQPGRWAKFLRAIALGVKTDDDITSACKGAVDAFDALLQLQRDH